MPYSHHSHSGDFCYHAIGTLSSMVEEAIKQGFKMYALTEHCPRWREEDLYPEEVDSNVRPEQLETTYEAFLTEAHRLKSSLSGTDGKAGTEILIGLETEHIYEEDLVNLKTLVDKYRSEGKIDFIVGSVHHADGHPIDFTKEVFIEALEWYMENIRNNRAADASEDPDQAALGALLEAYFKAQMNLIKTLRPEVIGHFSLPLLFTHQPETGPAKLSAHSKAHSLALENIRYAVSYGALFELSSAPFRKGWDEGWPGTETVQMIIQEGGLFCLSDDAHNTGQVGLNFGKMRDWAKSVGVTGKMIWRLRRKEGGGVEKVPCEDVWEDSFWDNR